MKIGFAWNRRFFLQSAGLSSFLSGFAAKFGAATKKTGTAGPRIYDESGRMNRRTGSPARTERSSTCSQDI